MRWGLSQTFEHIFALYISAQAASAVNLSEGFLPKQGEMHGWLVFPPTDVQASGLWDAL